MRGSHEDGFTLVELAVVLMVIGLLAAIALPHYAALTGRAREATVKSNMHLIQVAVEDFSVLSGGRYPDDGADVADNGLTLEEIVPGSAFPENPFTSTATLVVWDLDPTAGNRGEIGFNPATPDSYSLKGIGYGGSVMGTVLTTGR